MQKHMPSETNIAPTLHAELDAVQQQLLFAVDELYSPLGDLVRSQLKRAAPLVRATIILTAGVGDPDKVELPRKAHSTCFHARAALYRPAYSSPVVQHGHGEMVTIP